MLASDLKKRKKQEKKQVTIEAAISKKAEMDKIEQELIDDLPF
jgi:hypothetical protein